MPNSSFPGGVSSYGIPQLGTDGLVPTSTGAVYFVDSNASNASDGNYGSLKEPMATLDGAVNRASGNGDANKGAVIILMPNHAETISAAAGADLDVAGITVVGLGTGADRPTITFSTSTGADIDIDAANITVRNVLFVCAINSATALIDVNSTDFWLDNCEFQESSATGLACIDINGGAANACDRAKVTHCTFRCTTAGNWNTAIELGEVADGVEIRDNMILGDFDDAPVHNPTAKVLTNLKVVNNILRQNQTGQHAIELVSACTGVFARNLIATDAIATAADLGSLLAFDNWYQDTSDTDVAATPYPLTTTTAGLGLDQITDALYDSNGVVTYPAAAAPANGVSIAEVVRAIYDRQLGDGTDASANSLLGLRVNRTTADVLTGSAVNLYTIASGRVLITAIIGEVTTVIGSGTTPEIKFSLNPTVGTTVDISANLNVADDEAGTLYSVAGNDFTTATLVGSSGAVPGMTAPIVADIGTVDFTCDEDVTGSISFQIWYIPLDDGATITAA